MSAQPRLRNLTLLLLLWHISCPLVATTPFASAGFVNVGSSSSHTHNQTDSPAPLSIVISHRPMLKHRFGPGFSDTPPMKWSPKLL